LFHENLGNLTTEGNQGAHLSLAHTYEQRSTINDVHTTLTDAFFYICIYFYYIRTAFFYSSAPASELESLPDLWVIEKEDRHVHSSDEEPTTTSSASTTASSKSVGKQKDDGDRDAASDPQRISLDDTFHVKHALSGQYLTLTRATRPNASSSSTSTSTSSSSTTTTTALSMGSAELLQTSGTSLESMPSFSSGSSRSLQVLLNQQRRAREEWEEAERERMQGSRQAAMPRKSSGFLSHQRDAAHKAREHAPEYHLALAPARDEWTCFSFHHPFAHVRAHHHQVLPVVLCDHSPAPPPRARCF
jgi:hypothetical protein